MSRLAASFSMLAKAVDVLPVGCSKPFRGIVKLSQQLQNRGIMA
jgi:hypothetical protein